MNISTFFGLNVGVSGLQTAQQAENVISNNIANANTAGYVQESAQLGEYGAYPPLPANDAPDLNGQFGQGATVTAVNRDTNEFINLQDRSNQGTLQMLQTRQTILTQMEGITNEPSANSIRNAVDQFYTSWQTLSTDPTNTAARQSVVAQAQTLSQTLQTVTTQLAQLQTNSSQVVDQQFTQLNQDATQIATLNNQILSVQKAGESPNALLDQRDSLLNDMAKLANISYSQNASGSVSVTIGSQTLVSTSSNASSTSATFANTATNLALIQSGSIAGNAQGINDLTQEATNLSGIQQSFANTLNGLQAAGVDQSGNPGAPMFALGSVTATSTTSGGPTTTTYQFLTVPSTFGPGNVAAGKSGQGPSDNSNAIAVVNSQSQPISYTAYGGSTVSGPIDQLVSQVVTNLGTTTAAVNANLQTTQALAQQSSTLRQSISGVDINEQAAQMVQYQNAYSAAAKFVSVFDQMMQTLMGIVP